MINLKPSAKCSGRERQRTRRCHPAHRPHGRQPHSGAAPDRDIGGAGGRCKPYLDLDMQGRSVFRRSRWLTWRARHDELRRAQRPKFSSITWSGRRWSRRCRALSKDARARMARGGAGGIDERLAAIDSLLWTYKEDSFLAHGTRQGGARGRTARLFDDRKRHAQRRGRSLPRRWRGDVRASGLRAHRLHVRRQRCRRGSKAREQWTAAKSAGCPVTYWQQTAAGKWEKKA